MYLRSQPQANAREAGSRARVASRSARLTVKAKMKVVVTGAGGRTGMLVTKKLAERKEDYDIVAVVRGDMSKAKMIDVGVPPGSVFQVDVSKGTQEDYKAAFTNADALILATSAVPVMKPLSLIKVLIAKLFKQQGVMPDFGWKEGQTPQQIDWLGAKAQFDAAKEAGVKHVVVVGSMGGTQPDNMLNKLGDGNILMWKRKAEMYLIDSGLPYTIIHPGGLIDANGGERQLVVDVDDKLLARKVRSIPRGDVAELCIRVLSLDSAKNRSFDVISLPPEESEEGPTTDFNLLVTSLGSANCDYSINPPTQ